ncbi:MULTISPECIES: hypothetical protein [unclassified Candidatus Frackibacter]|uniref:hypothetical protein n=1 Tax=unclassified Candidatus Frackibacter TaxID=2648818 RepID=UPI0008890CAA|nr:MULTISPECIES: hypothetical protein [unclassified Candidatus Frackibacter]SDC15556.1 hypothetical protein SAMN04515661_10321 [Candidatus Frackibacter sp. WG11]SEM46116.1 hypothetical protein SAMN04488698_104121 [Candidatus Frackibacter sp. WG12]SFL48225.1 hypothetical protein SAMN04488699_103120 [Candidatus Frackibacter sp. WG13]
MNNDNGRDKNYIPSDKEIAEETNYDIIPKNLENNVELGRVKFPTVDGTAEMSGFEADVAQQIGRFSDRVQLGSPASEAGTMGDDAAKDIMKAADKKLEEKLNNNQK